LTEFTIYTTEAGSILLKGDETVGSGKGASQLLERAKQMGATSVVVTNEDEVSSARGAGLQATLIRPEDKERLDADKVGLIVRAKLAPSEAAALEIIRQQSIAAAEAAIREASSRPDLQLVQAIQALDETDKHLNIVSTRTAEWYGLHFPELTQMMQDNIALCRMISEVGTRDGYTAGNLAGRGLTEKKIEAILDAAGRSKGGEISDADMNRVKALAALAVTLSGERDKLNSYVEDAMKRIAPNVSEVAGYTIGARLMAKAGGLDRLAILPASTIQILGAEKALFRALRTGARPPKHGILFQHQEVHMAPKWQRGKIARTLANKIAISARVDRFRGTADPSLKAGLDKRLERIKEKYKEPPKRPAAPWRPQRRERPQRYGDRPQKHDRRQKFRRR
jgi:nucleolar protein 56